MSHPLHETEGASHAARGKGVCQAGQCDFLIAAPVKSFDSGDSNRDLHMLQVTRGAEFPLVTVRARVPDSAVGAGTVRADLEIQFAGQTVQYKQVDVPGDRSREYDSADGDHSGEGGRFQDRPSVAAGDAHQERYPGEGGYDLEIAVKRQTTKNDGPPHWG